ncbi:MAG: N-acetylglucosamine-6-phosphate deacetylase [Acidobacteria bacterium]|nr:N-acetylglucosamine-6-phosphate deacetylase [Acidobacteriota bacterium]
MSLQALFAARLLTPLEEMREGVVLIEDGTIRAAGPRADIAIPASAKRIELGDRTIAPGFIDIHIHGGVGHDVMEATPSALTAVARHLLRRGTTSFVPTTVSAPIAQLERSLDGLHRTLSAWKQSSTTPAAEPLGIHLEGPFISATCRGAHGRADLQLPSLELFERLRGAAGAWLKILTLAPELPGAAELQSHAQRHRVQVALGHSDASHQQARDAIDAGASHGVHIFNAMRRFAHREPGILGALLTDDRIMAEVIADGVHVAPAALQLLLRAKGVARTVLITDAVSATGMTPGPYRLGEMEILLSDDPATGLPACRNLEGALAGSVLTQDAAVRNMMSLAGSTLADAVRMASSNPAQLLGLGERKGIIRAGADADLVILNPDATVAGAVARGAVEMF